MMQHGTLSFSAAFGQADTPFRSCAPARRHLNPRCCCPECQAFDNGPTQPMRRTLTAPTIMTAIDSETGECFVYSYQRAASLAYLTKTPVPPERRQYQSQHAKQTFRSFLHSFVLEQVERSIQAHPFLWFCLSRLLP